MLDAYCPNCDAVYLYSLSRIRGLANSPLGIELTLECYCGRIIEVLTGWGPALPSESLPGRPRAARV